MKENKLIIFDFDGVIVNTFPFAYEINKKQSGITEEEYRKKFEGNIYEAPRTVNEQKIPQATFDFFTHYTPLLMNSDPEVGILGSIRELSEKYTLSIVSSTLTKSIDDYLERVGVRNCFQEILGPDIEKSKVKKINSLLEKYDIASSEAVLITDTTGDIQEAERCGVKSIAVSWGYHPRTTLEKVTVYRIIDKPEELIGAIEDYFAS